MNRKVVVVGTTTWGTTLAIILARSGTPVTLLARTAGEAKELNTQRQHQRFLPSVDFPPPLTVSSDVPAVIAPAHLVIIAVPSDRFRHNVQWIKPHLAPDSIVLSVTKGLEVPGSNRMSQVLQDELPLSLHPGICVLSGPNLAKEIVNGKPASTVVAGSDGDKLACVQETLMSPTFRVYTSEDLVGRGAGGNAEEHHRPGSWVLRWASDGGQRQGGVHLPRSGGNYSTRAGRGSSALDSGWTGRPGRHHRYLF